MPLSPLDAAPLPAMLPLQAGQHLVRAFRRKGAAARPGAVLNRLRQSGQAGDAFLLEEIKQATGAEQAEDLRSVTLSFYYPPS